MVDGQLRHIGLLVAHAAPNLAQAIDAELGDGLSRRPTLQRVDLDHCAHITGAEIIQHMPRRHQNAWGYLGTCRPAAPTRPAPAPGTPVPAGQSPPAVPYRSVTSRVASPEAPASTTLPLRGELQAERHLYLLGPHSTDAHRHHSTRHPNPLCRDNRGEIAVSTSTTEYSVVMSIPRSVRFADDVVRRLDRYVRSHPGASASSVTNLFVDEAMRTEEHPGIMFRPGPTGRRAALAGGPDVWEVIATLETVRAAGPDLEGDALVAAVADALGQTQRRVRVATRYYAAYPDEIDRRIAANNELADEAEAAWLAEQKLLNQSGSAAS
jgi:hypothetical protein